MIYAATVQGEGVTAGTYIVQPHYTHVDGVDAPVIEALPVNGLVPAKDDIVFCAEGMNDFLQSSQMIFNDNGGAFPLIIASLAQLLVFSVAMQIAGKVKLGQGGKKMLLGDTVQTWAQKIDAALTALYAWGATVSPPFPGTPALQPWSTAALSQNHELD
jgi:hypothetical protein